ncbi:30S ribosomal protein S6 [Candidatus Shapirobacteria bacterium]|nr:30S ribosomal protein S6 [Candidatus Shapirobacteria bacterium]
MKDTKHNYELVLVFNPKADEKDKEKNLKKVEAFVAENAGEIVKNEHLGNKDLVYKISDLDKGDFYVMQIATEKPLKIKEFNLYLNREPSIIRYLIIKK